MNELNYKEGKLSLGSKIDIGGNAIESVNDPEYVRIETDAEGKVLNAITRKGEGIIGGVNVNQLKRTVDSIDPETIKKEIEEDLGFVTGGLMKITKTSSYINMRTPFSDTEDFIMRYRIELNNNYTWNSTYIGSKNATDEEIIAGGTIQSMGDSTGPLACHGYAPWAMWAQHGYCIPYISATHSLTSDDIGSKWKDQRNREYSIGMISGSNIYLLPTIRETEFPGVYTRDWIEPRDWCHPEITSLTHVSGGVHTSTISVDSWNIYQIRPLMTLVSRKLLADGNEISEDGTYYCDDFVISETLNCTDPWTVEQWFPTPIQKEVGAVLTETFTMHGLSCRYDTILEMKKPYQFNWYGANQTMHFIPEEMPGYDVYGIMPRAKKNNYDSPHIIDSGYSIFRNSTDLRDVDKQVDRFISYYKHQTTGDEKIGCASGLSLTRGITKDSVRNTVFPKGSTTGLISITHTTGYTNKAYFKVLVGSAFENDIIPAGYIAQFSTYLSYFNPKANKGQVYWYKDGNGYVVYAHYQDANTNLAINLPDEMEGLSVEVVDKTDGVTLLTDIISNGRVYITSNSANNNYIVFKIQ